MTDVIDQGTDKNTATPGGFATGAVAMFERDTIIFNENEDSDFAYLVVEGRIELTKRIEGTEILLAEIGPGDLFGEMGLIDGSARSASAVCLTDSVLQRFDRTELMDRLEKDSDFAAPVLGQLVSQLRETSSRLAHEQALSLQRAADAVETLSPKSPGPVGRLLNFFDADADLIEFQPDAVEIEMRRTPALAKISLYTILFFIIGMVAWASLSSVDTAVSALGRITTEVPNIVIQPSETAIIRSIRVREGQAVEKGDLLATLDATLAQADVQVSRASLVSIMAQETRLAAEATGKMLVNGFSDDAAAHALQKEVFTRRQTGLKERTNSFDQQIRELQAEIKANIQDARDLGEQAQVLREIEAMRLKLVTSGYGSRVNYLAAKHQRLSVDRETRRMLSTRASLQHQLQAIRANRAAMLASWKTQVAQELVETRREREKLAEQVKKTEHRESLVRLVAPRAGVVLAIANRSVGSVIQQAETMFIIVPADVPMEMEADVLPRDIGLIKVGDEVRIKLDALPFQKHGTLTGRVRLISEDAVAVQGRAAETVYRTRIELTGRDLRVVPDTFRLSAGLTGSADITVGERRIITYFIYPLIRAVDTSFREP